MNLIEQKLDIIDSLDKLITALNTGEKAAYDGLIRSMCLPIHVFKDYAFWSDSCYTRNCIVENEKFELILLCWEAGQITPIHNHGGEECWVKFIEGQFRENIYTENKAGELKMVKTINSGPNDVSYMIDFMGFHNLENLSNKRSMSLHFYAKPIRSCKIFDKKSQKFVNKDLTYYSCPELAVI